MQKYPSMTSVQSVFSMGYMPPGHGYIPKKVKPDKPYGPSFISVMNRPWRGPGRKYMKYATITFCIFIIFIVASGLYVGHRNVSRMIVLRTEVFGAAFIVISILLCGLMFHFIVKARKESDKWRSCVRFRAEGMFLVAAYNPVYNPEDSTKLKTGTYGRKALRIIPKGKKGPKGRSRAGSKSSVMPPGGLQRGIFDKKAQQYAEGIQGPYNGDPGESDYAVPDQPQYPVPGQQYGYDQQQYPPEQYQGQQYPGQPQYPPPGQDYSYYDDPSAMYAQVQKKEERQHIIGATGESAL